LFKKVLYLCDKGKIQSLFLRKSGNWGQSLRSKEIPTRACPEEAKGLRIHSPLNLLQKAVEKTGGKTPDEIIKSGGGKEKR